MTQVKFGSAGVSAREIDISGPTTVKPTGIPAGVIGTAKKGKAFVPITVGVIDDWYAKFGLSDGEKFGPLAVSEWLRNQSSVTYLRVLGVGDGKRRATSGATAGAVTNGGFLVGEEQPDSEHNGLIRPNPYANSNGPQGRLYFLGCLMSESNGSTVFSSAGLQGTGTPAPSVTAAVPIIRGVVMAPSGVLIRMSSSAEGTNTAPAATAVGSDAAANGKHIGSVVLRESSIDKQDFVLLLNGHKGTDPLYPNVITASFDVTAPNYFANVLNRDPYSYQKAGHYLYANWDVHPSLAVVTGTGVVVAASGAFASYAACSGKESSAFITTGSLPLNTTDPGAYQPKYESFNTRFEHAKTPWVFSQKFGGRPTNLFRVHALDDGALDSTTMLKVSIENIAKSTDPAYLYGTFDLVVRQWSDRDEDPQYIEQWRGLSLDPASDQYISKVVGDLNAYFEFDRAESAQKLVVEGSYDNKSNLIRIEVSTDVDLAIVSPTALPMGVRGAWHTVTSGTMPLCSPVSTQHSVDNILFRSVQPPVPLRTNITTGVSPRKLADPLLYWGVQFEHVTNLSSPNGSYLKDSSLDTLAKYFPDFFVSAANFVTGSNEGTAASVQLGITDADVFCNNVFSLENISVVTGSNTIADPQQWVSATYVRNGVITANEADKTRALTVDDLTIANRKFAKFTFFAQGGFNGTNAFDRDEATLTNYAVYSDNYDPNRGGSEGPNVKSWKKAIDVMKNTSIIDVQLLVVPGIREPVVTDYAVAATENRFDALYIMDISERDQGTNVVLSSSMRPSVQATADNFSARSLDSSFAAAYFPDVVVQDPNTKTNVYAPPSVVVLGAFALNDALGHPWFAPAGFTRGALSTAQETRVRLKKENMDTLYDVNINPIVSFPAPSGQGLNPTGGCVVWGQKTLQASASALDRVNVRRLLIDLRRQVRDVARTFTFEPNRETTLANFSKEVDPILKRAQTLSGIEKYKIVIDTTTTTQEDVENNVIRGKIWLAPYKSIEFVSLDFVVSNKI